MNYLTELNLFYRYCLSKKSSKSEIALLHALYMINNAEDWKVWFDADNELVQRLTGGYSREAINEARNRLKQKGRIDFRAGERNVESAKYRIIPFDSNHAENNVKVDKKVDMKVDMKVDIEVDKEVDIQHDMKVDTNTKHKQDINKTENKKKVSTPKRPTIGYEEIIAAYTDDEALKSALWAYIQMRISKRAKPTNYALELVLKRLGKLSGDIPTQIAILEKSIANNWTDVYELKDKGVPGDGSSSKHNGAGNECNGANKKPRYGNVIE